ncbi:MULTISPECIES: ATP-binding protein [unclassified Paenibacillus]|uniref:sensor histidine kinase n=1 Tax=unclassified Paenibacillus TaxID=185978 RepID=UPI0010474C1D|nr:MULTISPECIES: ATP-binding protein [unclassified Paenibacillus]NIK68028.1 two-component system sensor histidine kinase YcbA [Paenibacillus sp. BK720]TCN02002.1 two-component system sensor histidine kinase YcbA [Paenibacillus sp. BK033]
MGVIPIAIQNWSKSESMQITVVAIVVAVAGEFKINPFIGEVFRIGLGSSAFLFLLLLMSHLPYWRTGIAAGATVLLFRVTFDGAASSGAFFLLHSIKTHFSAMLYYMVFGAGMVIIRRRLQQLNPLILGACVSLIDVVSNEAELLMRSFVFGLPHLQSNQWMLISVIAVVRSYFTTGIYSSIAVHQMRIIHAEQQKRMEQMINVGSGLYGEVFYLRKSMDVLEKITAKSHDLYGRLNKEGLNDYGRTVLGITQQIHEVKKDSQRILAGLMKLFDLENAQEMTLSEVVELVAKSNGEYSRMLKKEVRIEIDVGIDYLTAHYIPLITVLNNLAANSVEAIDRHGSIGIRVCEREEDTLFIVSDTGTGITEQDKDMVFEPGFTTKFNQEGVAATGIGLSHVRDIVSSFTGRLFLTGRDTETTFTAVIPTDQLKKGV